MRMSLGLSHRGLALLGFARTKLLESSLLQLTMQGVEPLSAATELSLSLSSAEQTRPLPHSASSLRATREAMKTAKEKLQSSQG
jgi:hypothetical protein